MTMNPDHPQDPANDIARNLIEARIRPTNATLTSDDGTHFFSGVFVSARGRHFIATVKHGIDGIRDWSTLRVLTHSVPETKRPLRTIGRLWATSPEDPDDPDKLTRYDIGLICVHPENIDDLQAGWISIENMRSTDVVPGTLVALMGCPRGLMRRERSNDAASALLLRPMIYSGPVTFRSPGFLIPPADNYFEFFVEYDPRNASAINPNDSTEYLDPVWLSGCGVFLIKTVPSGSLWDPGPLCLAGIQSSFLSTKKLLRIKRSEHLRRLVDRVCDAIERDGPEFTR